MPRPGQRPIQTRHFTETLNHAARPNQRHDRATLASAADKTREQAEPSRVNIIHA
jgi:hypothetical protein